MDTLFLKSFLVAEDAFLFIDLIIIKCDYNR